MSVACDSGMVSHALDRPSAARPPTPSSLDLAAVVRAARTGDHRAWARLVERFDPVVRGVARGFRLSAPDVDDVAQTTWMRCLQHIGGLEQPAAISGWLATVARRESLRLLQSPVREQLSDDPLLGDSTEPVDLGAALIARERRACLERALSTLPDRHRRLMVLIAEDPNADYRRLSAELDMPHGSIGPIRRRCLDRLARCRELRELHATPVD